MHQTLGTLPSHLQQQFTDAVRGGPWACWGGPSQLACRGDSTLRDREAEPAAEPSRDFTSSTTGSATVAALTHSCCLCTATLRAEGLGAAVPALNPVKLGMRLVWACMTTSWMAAFQHLPPEEERP